MSYSNHCEEMPDDCLNATGQCRLISPVLCDVPWYTTVISQCKDLTDVGTELGSEVLTFKVCCSCHFPYVSCLLYLYQRFVQHLHQYESQLLNRTSCNGLLLKMLGLLGLKLQVEQGSCELVRHSSSTNLSVGDWTRLCSLVSAYRLLDVIALLGCRVPRALYVTRRPLDPSCRSLFVRIHPSLARSSN